VGNGTEAGRNVIAYNTYYGVRITGSKTDGNIVAGNCIGTGASGFGKVPNKQHGVLINGGAQSNRVGIDESSPSKADANVIAGNTMDGVKITNTCTSANVVYSPPNLVHHPDEPDGVACRSQTAEQ